MAVVDDGVDGKHPDLSANYVLLSVSLSFFFFSYAFLSLFKTKTAPLKKLKFVVHFFSKTTRLLLS